MTRYIKFLTADGRGPYSGFVWPLPTDDGPGEWVAVDGDLVACERGLHATTPDHALEWLDAAAYAIAFKRRPRTAGNKVVGRTARLVRRLAWDDRVARLFACDCAERALPVYERAYPGDTRPRETIATARRFARGEATREELAAARAAAGAAAGDAARAAAWAAARAAAGDAARAAARAAAGAAAGDAAGDAARDAAGAAAGAAAGDAAWDAARAAASPAARDAARAALRPTVETLQASALDLLDRMIDPAAEQTGEV
jgi:hypothetical protein